MDELSLLADYLSDETKAPPLVKRKSGSVPVGPSGELEVHKELELWWPILLGLSQASGDSRLDLRSKALEILMKVINSYFIPSVDARDEDIQTLQIIFRGILFPILEFAEFGLQEGGSVPTLPSDFERFLSGPKEPKSQAEEQKVEADQTCWMETMFDPFIDACVAVCLRSMEATEDNALVEEVLSVLNNCLTSDSGYLAVRGLHRLEQFISSDLELIALTDDVWATVSHMLRKCLAVRGLPAPRNPRRPRETEGSSEDTGNATEEEEYRASIAEFMSEDRMTLDRRYLGGNATMLIGTLLGTERFDVGLRWRLFLVAGLGQAIVDWERAAYILGDQKHKRDSSQALPYV
jgi:hypothetical protein